MIKKTRFLPSLIFSFLLIAGLLFIFGSAWLYQLMGGSKSAENFVFPSQEAGRILLIQAKGDLIQSKATLLEGNLEIELIGGYGQYPLGSVWPLLALDQRPQQFVRAVYSFVFHQPIARVIAISLPKTDKSLNWDLQRLLWQKIVSFSTSQSERLALFKTSLILRHHPIKSVQRLHHPDELMALVDAETSVFKMRANECGLAILNASELTGLASQFRQLIELNQGYVVRVDDATQNLPKTMLVIDVQKGSSCDKTAALINQLLPFDVSITRTNDVYTTYRTPVALLLGEDLAETWIGSL